MLKDIFALQTRHEHSSHLNQSTVKQTILLPGRIHYGLQHYCGIYKKVSASRFWSSKPLKMVIQTQPWSRALNVSIAFIPEKQFRKQKVGICRGQRHCFLPPGSSHYHVQQDVQSPKLVMAESHLQTPQLRSDHQVCIVLSLEKERRHHQYVTQNLEVSNNFSEPMFPLSSTVL